MEQRIALVVAAVGERHKQLLEAAAPEFTFRYSTIPGLKPEEIEDAEILFGNAKPALLKEAKKLRWMQTTSSGADRFYKPGILPEGTILTCATGAYGTAVSEYMLTGLMCLSRGMGFYRDAQNQAVWKPSIPFTPRAVCGSTVLVLGLGDIGGHFAKMVKAMGAYVIGVRRKNTDKPDYVDELHLSDELDSLLPRADTVAISLPGGDATNHLFTAERIARMKDGALLINIGRGTIVDTAALMEALQSGKLGGACLDVTDPEPLPDGHPLWNCKNAIITPHISYGKMTFDNVMEIALENLRRYVAGQPLMNLVDPETGYRKR